MLAAVPYSEDKYRESLDVKALFGEKGYSTLERTAIRPTFDVCGIWGGGFTGEGSKTVLPSKAYAKVSGVVWFRIRNMKNIRNVYRLYQSYCTRLCTGKVTPMHGEKGMYAR